MRLYIGIVCDLLKTSHSISTVPWASFHGFWGFPWVLQGSPSSFPRVLQGFCGFSSIGFGLPCFCKYYKVLQSITPYYYTVILRPRKSTILCLYYSFAPLYFDSTILWLYYSLLYDSFTLRYRSYIGSFSTKLPLMNTHWHLYIIFTMYTTKKMIMKNYPQQKSKKMRLRFFLLLKICNFLSKASKKSPQKKKTNRLAKRIRSLGER